MSKYSTTRGTLHYTYTTGRVRLEYITCSVHDAAYMYTYTRYAMQADDDYANMSACCIDACRPTRQIV